MRVARREHLSWDDLIIIVRCDYIDVIDKYNKDGS